MTAEQQARDMVERITGREDAQELTAGDVVELANLIEENARLQAYVKQLTEWELAGESLFVKEGFATAFRLSAWWFDRPWRRKP